MRIDKTIDKWFREIAEKMSSTPKEDKPIYDLCSSVLPLAHNYCDATLLLLDSNKNLPAMALLRILSELTFRLIWCLSTYNNPQEDVDIRIKRWLKESYKQRKRNLKKLLPSAGAGENKNIKKEIDFLQKEIDAIPYKFAGDLYNSLDELTIQTPDGKAKSLSWKDDLYPILYTQFNQAIHPDLLVLGRLIKQNENIRIFSGDFNDIDIVELKIYCMSCAFNIISYIRIIYDLDYQNVKTEYLDIKKRFKSKKA